jgi:hypothetical protein
MAPASRHRLPVDGRPPSRRLRAAFHARLALVGYRGKRSPAISGPGSYTHGRFCLSRRAHAMRATVLLLTIVPDI